MLHCLETSSAKQFGPSLWDPSSFQFSSCGQNSLGSLPEWNRNGLLRQLILWNLRGLAFTVHIPLGILVFWTTITGYYYLFIVTSEFSNPKPTKSSSKPTTAMAPHFCTRLVIVLAIVLMDEGKRLEKSSKRTEAFTLARGLRGLSIQSQQKKVLG